MIANRPRLSRSASSMPIRLIQPFRPAVLTVLAVVAVASSWGVELLVQASAPVNGQAPASVKPAAPSASIPRNTVGLGGAAVDPGAAKNETSAAGAPGEAKPKGEAEAKPEGPALEVPREVVGMLELRKRDLDHREDVVRQSEERLTLLKAELETILSKYEKLVEAAEKRRKDAREKREKQAGEDKAKAEQKALELRNQHQAQLAKIFESMPVEEAAARLEKMPDRKALEVLRLVKGKTAGAILAQMKVDRAAKLTELLLVQAP